MGRAPATQEVKDQGRRLQQLREALDLTQPAVADIMGCAPNTVSGYESGRTRIDILNLRRLCEHLGISADWIVLGTLGVLPMDVAARIQANQRREVDNPKRRRGRPRGEAVPTVNDAPEWPKRTPSRSVHERPARFVPPPGKHTM